jgi:hypothetical protein
MWFGRNAAAFSAAWNADLGFAVRASDGQKAASFASFANTRFAQWERADRVSVHELRAARVRVPNDI